MKTVKGAISHHHAELIELAADRELAIAYLKAALEALSDAQRRAGGLLALRTIAEAFGGLEEVAAAAGISTEALELALPASPQLRDRQ
jgi:DNA-binding phage protein